jgi:hypothetical protein
MADQVNNKQKHSLGKGARVGKNGGDGSSIGEHPGAIAATLAVQGAADTIAAEIVAKADALPSRTGGAPPPAAGTPDSNRAPASGVTGSNLTVGKVDGNKVYINGGENLGVKINDYYDVRRVTGTMKDPSGNDIETDERVETIVVTDVQDKFSVAKSASGTTVAKVGDRLKKAKAPAAPPKKAAANAPAPPAAAQRKQ